MALLKDIVLTNGITTNYHRIVNINNITNQVSIIEIGSYTSKAKRLEEKAALTNKTSMDVYIKRTDINKEYTKELNVDTAYIYLKTLDMFTGYTDDLDE